MNQNNTCKKKVSKLDTFFDNFFEKALFITVVVLILIFILWPIFSVIKESFLPSGTLSLDTYKNLLSNNKRIINNSIFVGVLTTIFSTILSVFISIYTSFSNSKIKKILILILMITMISPPFVSSLAYINLFGRRGFITHHLLKLTLNPYGWVGIVIMQTISNVSLNSLLLTGIIEGVDKNLLMASQDLGSSPSYAIRKVLVPVMVPGIVVCALLTFIRSLSDFGTPMVIGGSFDVLATEVYMKIIASSDLPMASAMSVLILIPSLVAFLVYRVYMKNFNLKLSGNNKITSSDAEFKLKGFLNVALSSVTIFYIVVMLLQYLSIFISSISKYSYGKFMFTAEHYVKLNNYSADCFVRSVVYSLITGVLGSILGMIIAYFTERRNIKGMKTVDFISTLPYIIPGIFFGIGYILAFNDPPLELTGTVAIVVLNCIFKQMPMTTKASSAVISQINGDIEHAARDLGAKNIYVIKDIIIPNLKTAFVVGFINNFTATMTTVGAIIFLVYPGQKVATLEMFDAIQTGNYGVGAAIATIIILITLIVNLVVSKLILREKR
ncbi:iron(III) transport system permease protein [Clostridium collagenovorans DSM 3089]|uniref:Iron(III) transport system permease protein n=1 Tax=Clostridium collagenovorans DSM 3089 TaxID=1121306 RepID=A0A1M5XAH0_9CLOT|nr:iron ABC transporter permease [Clostridium collagenovorans]SHH96203.1 iron(III) transport system permease protein [Clostridium collagenovorans DSM 3089]